MDYDRAKVLSADEFPVAGEAPWGSKSFALCIEDDRDQPDHYLTDMNTLETSTDSARALKWPRAGLAFIASRSYPLYDVSWKVCEVY